MAPRDARCRDVQGGEAHGVTRSAESPKAGWRAILVRVKDEFSDVIGIVSAGVAFNEFFALFPALAAAISIYGLVADADTVQRQMVLAADVLPAQARSVIESQLGQLANAPSARLGWSLALSILLALWGATRGTKALISGLNIVYREEEKRGFIKLTLLSLGLTLAAIVFGLVALALIAALPAIIDLLPLGDLGRLAVTIVRWPILAVMVLIALAVVYRFAPSRDRVRWRWASRGAAVAAALWLAGSALFSLYVSNFGKVEQTYGSLAAVAIVLLWFQLTSAVVLLGGLLDAEWERQAEQSRVS